ncbi:unnamed protein product [Onchocerca ochengi]|uniref:Uncharacterized protein n=1 Tax=Onchocerca ochengi TaxID=42157 RepID=A0A182E7H5_ONCOC|nr:unnamed protein product [Onchocerca ochengi]
MKTACVKKTVQNRLEYCKNSGNENDDDDDDDNDTDLMMKLITITMSFDIETESRWMQPGRENRRSTSDCYRGGSILMQHIVPAAQLAPNCRGTELPTCMC